MNVPRILGMHVDLLREEVSRVRIMRLGLGRARICTQLRHLLSLVSSTAEVERVGRNAVATVYELFDALSQDDLPGLEETSLIQERRKRALDAVGELERVLCSAMPSDEARRLGLDWRAEGTFAHGSEQ